MKQLARILPAIAVVACAPPPNAQVAGNLPKADGSTIGYETVADALAAVLEMPGTETRQENGWLIVIDERNRTIWSFAPEDHPAYPTAVQRVITPAAVGSNVDTNVLCESDKVACDNVVLQFDELTNRALGRSR